MKFILYNPASGEIRITGNCPDADFELQARTGLTLIEGEADELSWVNNGVVATYTPEQAALRAARPSFSATWSNQTFSWHDTRTLDQCKTTAWSSIKAERSRRMGGTFTHAGNTYDIDPVNLSGATIDAREALIAGELLWSQMWVLSNNTVVTLTATQMIAVGRACKTVVSNLWATSQYLRGLIDAATTPDQVDAVAWP